MINDGGLVEHVHSLPCRHNIVSRRQPTSQKRKWSGKLPRLKLLQLAAYSVSQSDCRTLLRSANVVG